MTTLETVLQEAKKEGRICPQPIKWNEFTKILNEASGSRPPPPLILAAWFEPHLSKTPLIREIGGYLSSALHFVNSRNMNISVGMSIQKGIDERC